MKDANRLNRSGQSFCPACFRYHHNLELIVEVARCRRNQEDFQGDLLVGSAFHLWR